MSKVDEIAKLKGLLDEGSITKDEYEGLKAEVLGNTTPQKTGKEETKGVNRKATFYDFIVTITLFIAIFATGGGLIGGAIIGLWLGFLAWVSTKITKDMLGQIFIYLISGAISFFVLIAIISSFENSDTAYNDCRTSAYEEYKRELDFKCDIKIGNSMEECKNTDIPCQYWSCNDGSDLDKAKQTLENEYDRCVVLHK